MNTKVNIFIFIATLLVISIALPQKFSMPVEGASKSSYNAKSFWYYPWGRSGTHKGVDIFAKEGTNIHSAVKGIVLYSGKIEMGGNVVIVLDRKFRLYYYAHLQSIKAKSLSFADRNDLIGTVGTTGNAKGKSPHLHFSIVTLIPYLWRTDASEQGWKKMFYLNPIDYLENKNLI